MFILITDGGFTPDIICLVGWSIVSSEDFFKTTTVDERIEGKKEPAQHWPIILVGMLPSF